MFLLIVFFVVEYVYDMFVKFFYVDELYDDDKFCLLVIGLVYCDWKECFVKV